jgi:hypothetical protein
MTLAEQPLEQAKLLPDPPSREAFDFVLLVRQRQRRREWRKLMDAQGVAIVGLFRR